MRTSPQSTVVDERFHFGPALFLEDGVNSDAKSEQLDFEARVACRVTPVSDEKPPLFPSEPQRAQREALVPMTSRYD
jgi:hypothetical protein